MKWKVFWGQAFIIKGRKMEVMRKVGKKLPLEIALEKYFGRVNIERIPTSLEGHLCVDPSG